jgi:hypothetical protein
MAWLVEYQRELKIRGFKRSILLNVHDETIKLSGLRYLCKRPSESQASKTPTIVLINLAASLSLKAEQRT